MSEVIVITSGKGGVGKTTTTANIGTGLAQLNKKVVMIDTDIGLRNLDVVMGLENRIVYNLVDVVEGKCRIRQALIKDKKYPDLCLLPSAQTRDKDAVTPEQMVELINELREEFDYILLDCPAGIEQGFKNAVASLHNIAVRRLKISRIPRIRNIAAGTGEGKKFVNLSIRIIFQHPVQIADIRGIHADDVVGALVILPRNLLRVMRHERNVLLAQFIDCPVVRRIADLLAAGGEAVDFKIVGKAEGIYFVGEYALSKSRAANITVAYEKYFNHKILLF